MQFDPPGFLEDLDATGKQAWSDWISKQLDDARARNSPGLQNDGPRLQFFNPRVTPPAADATEKDITWSAFPRIVELNSVSDKQRWRSADSSRDVQDEYCEWSVTRDPQTEKITRVTFTSEGPEYWHFLAATNPARLLDLYRAHIGPQVKMTDLVRNGKYVPRNRWNNSTTNGAMHLIQQNNTLSAEIELAAAASIVRLSNGQALTDVQALIECGAYGQAERHSDPFIGASVNELARAKADVTLANPVGLYIAGLSVAGWQTPDGTNPMDFWKVTRGTKEKTLRAVFEVPAAKNYVVGDIRVDNRPIEFGAQIVDFVTIKLTGLATRIGQSNVAPLNGCVRSGALAPADAAVSVAEVLERQEFAAYR
jgi:hypothetical protein